jgi:nucleoid-associated protein YgaU
MKTTFLGGNKKQPPQQSTPQPGSLKVRFDKTKVNISAMRSNIAIAAITLIVLALLAGLSAAYIFPPADQPVVNRTGVLATEPRQRTKPVKVASAAATTAIPGAYNPGRQVADIRGGETIISTKTGGNLNPYKPPQPTSPRAVPVPRNTAAPVPVAQQPVSAYPAPAAPRTKALKVADDSLRSLTDNVVSTLKQLKKQETTNNPAGLVPATNDLRSAISALVEKASARGKSSAYVQALIDDALAGRDVIPTALANPDGTLDTSVLLASVLPRKNLTKFGNSDAGYLSALESESQDLAKNRLPSTAATRVKKARYIIVRRGDNLSKIALRVYGDPLAYVRIYQANRRLLVNANTLDIGQRLLVP